MTVAQLLGTSGSLRYALRDQAGTRYTQETLLTLVNKAIHMFASDTMYFHAYFELRIVPNKAVYALDDRILKVFKAHTKECTYNLLDGSLERCYRKSSKIRRITSSYGATKELRIWPILSELPEPDTDFEGIVLDNNDEDNILPTYGVTLHIDDNGNVSPIVNVLDEYLPIALLCAYTPDPLTMDGNVPEQMLAVMSAIETLVVYLATTNSNIAQSVRIADRAYKLYTKEARKYKRLVTSKFISAKREVAYRTPFGTPSPRIKDF